MRSSEFPFCCTGSILGSFGENEHASGYYSIERPLTAVHIRERIKQEALANRGHAFICITSNDKQPVLNSVLRDMGFEHSKWMSKRQHPSTKVRIWWKHVPTLLEEITNELKESYEKS